MEILAAADLADDDLRVLGGISALVVRNRDEKPWQEGRRIRRGLGLRPDRLWVADAESWPTSPRLDRAEPNGRARGDRVLTAATPSMMVSADMPATYACDRMVSALNAGVSICWSGRLGRRSDCGAGSASRRSGSRGLVVGSATGQQ
jgi:hypothetical protein